jgi:predicted ATPase
LPAQLTSIIGRDSEIASIRDLLAREDVRLLTLTGPGGTGKTRLSIQAGANSLRVFPDGVFFVPLAAVSDPHLVCSEIARTLGVKESAGAALEVSLSTHLRERHTLLILDNFEQALAAAPLVADLLAACPRIKILVTSRAPLRLRGEHEFAVPPLALPDSPASLSAEALSRCAAVALFVERVRLVKPQFQLAEDNASALAEICLRLDGLPLAIELAAARSKVLTPQNLLARMTDRLSLLVAGARDLPARQQTIRNTIKWSYDLLDDQEQRLFRYLSVFVSGFTLDAAEEVCKASDSLQIDVLDGVASLFDKSLLQQQSRPDGEQRFSMLETIREYGLQQLVSHGESEGIGLSHAQFFLRLAEMAEPELLRKDQKSWLDRLESEHDNLRAALNRAEENNDSEMGLRLAGALWRFWLMRSHLGEGRQRLARALNLDPAATPTEARAKALNGLATLTQNQGNYESARALYDECLSIWRALGDRRGVATTLVNLGWIAFHRCDYESARSLSEEGLVLHSELNNQPGVALALNNLGFITYYQGEYESARVIFLKTADLRREMGEKRGLAFALTHLARCLLKLSDFERARADLDEAMALIEAIGDKQGIAYALAIRGELYDEQGDSRAALPIAEKGIGLWREIGDKFGLSFGLIILANIVFNNGDAKRAAALYAESLTIEKQLLNRRDIAECLERLTNLCISRNRHKEAATLLGAARALREGVRSLLAPNETKKHNRSLEVLCAALGDEAFQTSWAQGRSMTVDETIAYALSEAKEM